MLGGLTDIENSVVGEERRFSPHFIWDEQTVKEFFSVSKLWPSFIGHNDKRNYRWKGPKDHALKKKKEKNQRDVFGEDDEQPLNASFPVLVWPEQTRHMIPQQQAIGGVGPKQNNKKRKREQIEVTYVEDVLSPDTNGGDGTYGLQKKSKNWDGLGYGHVLAQKFRSFWDKLSVLNPFASKNSAPNTDQYDDIGSKLSRSLSPRDIRQMIFTYLHTYRGSLQQDGKTIEFTYFIGPADVYGGDFGLYKTLSHESVPRNDSLDIAHDPSKTHSVATVRIIDEPTCPQSGRTKMSAKELLSFARVQHQVKKAATVAFAAVSEDSKAQNESTLIHFLSFRFKGVAHREK